MKKVMSTILAAICLVGTTHVQARGQQDVPSFSISGGQLFTAGQLQLLSDVASIDNKAFTCVPLQPLTKGTLLAAQVSSDQTWSVDSTDIGGWKYPLFSIVHGQSVFAANFIAKIDMKAGDVVHSGGYVLEAKRQINAKDNSFEVVLVVGKSVLAGYWGLDKDVADRPWFTAFPEGTTPSDCIAAADAWRIVNNRIYWHSSHNTARPDYAKGPDAIASLVPALKDSISIVRRNATDELGKSKDSRAVEALIDELLDADADVRISALLALGNIGVGSAVEPLISLLKDPVGAVRLKAVNALGSFADKRATQPLIGALSDSDVAVRAGAITALCSLNEKTAVPALIKEFHDPDPNVRGLSVSALGHMKATTAAKSLVFMLKSEGNADVRFKIVVALTQITSKHFATYAQWNSYINQTRPGGAR